MSATTKILLLTAPCGCKAIQEGRPGSVTWGVDRCPEHRQSETLPQDIEEFFAP